MSIITRQGERPMTMKNPPHPGGVVLRQCIEPLGLSITDAAAALGVTRNTTPPGCGGFFMVMGRSPCLVIIDIINVLGVAFCKTEDHPPVGAYRNSPKA